MVESGEQAMFECCKQAVATTSAELEVGNDDMGDLYPVLPSYEVGDPILKHFKAT